MRTRPTTCPDSGETRALNTCTRVQVAGNLSGWYGDDVVKYVTTSVFDSPAQTLVNTVNTVGVMGKGIALEFKRRYPPMYERYKTFCTQGSFGIGQLYVYRTADKWILNFPTKKHWRNPSKLEYIEAGLAKLVATYTDQGITSISLPQLGCGNGGLEWSVVQPLMERYLNQLAIPVYIHSAQPKAGFIPEHKKTKPTHSSTKVDVGFTDFLADLREVSGMPPIEKDHVAWASALGEPLPPLELHLNALHPVSVASEDLEDLWHSLRAHGAVSVADVPKSLRHFAMDLFGVLQKLDYIRSITFVTQDKRPLPGVRYVPPASDGSAPMVATEPDR